MTRWVVASLWVVLGLGCHRANSAGDAAQKSAAPTLAAPSPFPILDPKLFPAVSLSTTQPAAPEAASIEGAPPRPEPAWQQLDSRRGQFDFDSVTMDFIPRSATWRFRLTTDKTPAATAKPGQDHSYVKVSLWMGEKDGNGAVGYRAVKVDFKRKGGAGCVQEFTNGLFPGGQPRPFRIMINGSFIEYAAIVEDLGAT